MSKNGKTVLVIDGGGRGSVLVDKYLESPQVGQVLAIPGNDLMGIGSKKKVKTFPQIKTTDLVKIVKVAKKENVDLVDVAQDDAVAAGLTDALQKAGIKAFGPTKLAGQIEWDKAWARKFMEDINIPIPAYKICTSEEEGIEFINSQKDQEWFIKASGLALGKGVLHANNNKEAKEKIKQMKNFGKSGKTFLIEQRLEGEEFSSYAMVNGEDFVLLGHAQDHKTIYDADQGPNTGGIGSTSTPLCITKEIESQIKAIFKKTTAGLVKIGRPYTGILYLGGMISPQGKIFIIEFNSRWGDPEAEVVIPSIKNDFYTLATQTIAGNLKKLHIKKDTLYRIVVTACAWGYPVDYSPVKGKQIVGLDKILSSSEVKVFGAGVEKSGKKYVASGGRLFHVMAEDKDVIDARQKAYRALSQVHIEGNNLHFRTDIGWRDLERIDKIQK